MLRYYVCCHLQRSHQVVLLHHQALLLFNSHPTLCIIRCARCFAIMFVAIFSVLTRLSCFITRLCFSSTLTPLFVSLGVLDASLLCLLPSSAFSPGCLASSPGFASSSPLTLFSLRSGLLSATSSSSLLSWKSSMALSSTASRTRLEINLFFNPLGNAIAFSFTGVGRLFIVSA